MLSFVDTSEHFSDAIASVTQIILENEVPVLDYVIVKPSAPLKLGEINLESQEDAHPGEMTALLKFKDIARKVIVLNKGRETTKSRLLETIEIVRARKRLKTTSLFKSLQS